MKSTQQYIDEKSAVAFSGSHGMTGNWRETHRGEVSVCPAGDSLYPSHAFDAVTDQPDGAEWVCAACEIRAEDIDEGGVRLLRCEHGEEPGYCDCGWEAGQR
jgi:hypothetical protein